MVLLAAANAKYIHTSLALYALRSFCRLEFPGIRVEEFNINQHMDWVLNRIYLLRPRVAAFSVNIWNLHFTLELADRLKKVAPGTVIVLGGPEAGAAAAELMAVEPAIDYIVRGEGEETFRELLGFLLRRGEPRKHPRTCFPGRGRSPGQPPAPAPGGVAFSLRRRRTGGFRQPPGLLRIVPGVPFQLRLLSFRVGEDARPLPSPGEGEK